MNALIETLAAGCLPRRAAAHRRGGRAPICHGGVQ